jgi:glycosyltransferase involved in cell wall biosynthesis
MRRQIRAIHVVPGIENEASGPSYSVVRLCEGLIDAGENVRLGVVRSFAPKPAFVHVFAPGRGPRRLGCSPQMRRWLRSEVSTRQTDIVHSHSLWTMPNVYPGWVTRGTECRLVVSPRGTLSEWALERSAVVKRVFWTFAQRVPLRRAACFHATSRAELEDIRRAGFRQPICVVPNGVDVPPLASKPTKRRRTLLFLGRIHPVKGVDVLLHAWRAVSARFPEWELHIAGPDDGHLATIRATAETLDAQRVTFCGPVYGSEKLRALREAELFVLPTRSENFGLAVAEALAAGTPAVVTRAAPWDGLERARAGWWIEQGVEPLVACLNEALQLPHHELAARGLAGRDWISREFSWRRVATMMDETYRWLLWGGDAPPWVYTDSIERRSWPAS